MIKRSVQRERRRVVARLLAEGASVNAIAKHLRIGWESANREVTYVRARLDSAEYITAERAVDVTLERMRALEEEALGHVRQLQQRGQPELANRWFESARRIMRYRSRLLERRTKRRAAGGPGAQSKPTRLALSPRAHAIQKRIARAEKQGRAWEVRVTFEVPEALEPVLGPLPKGLPALPAWTVHPDQVDVDDGELDEEVAGLPGCTGDQPR